MNVNQKNKITAPEGGWGWFIVLGYAVNNMVVLPTMTLFTLMYNTHFSYLGFTNFQVNAILVTNISFGMLMAAIFNGPILRNVGYRKIALLGAFLVFMGNLATSQSTKFYQFIIFYGLGVSMGTNLVMAAFNLALNTYFITKRGIATGIAMTITGIGPIVMPLLVPILVASYGAEGTGALIAAISSHAIPAALLLQPVKWHKKKKEKNPELGEVQEKLIENNTDAVNDTEHDENIEMNTIHQCTNDNIQETERSTLNNRDDKINSTQNHKTDINSPIKSLDDIVRPDDDTIWQRVVKFFDFDLLKDPIYLNISVGLALGFFSEMSFSTMLPKILMDLGIEIDSVGSMMSLLAGADILSRFVTPFLNESIKSRVRVVYIFSLFSGIIFRTCLLYAKPHGYFAVYIVVGFLGFTKGIRTVYTALVIPNYVPLHKLPAATGLQMVINGIVLAIVGFPLGTILNRKASYNLWIYILNSLTGITIAFWGLEMYFRKTRKNKAPIVKRVER